MDPSKQMDWANAKRKEVKEFITPELNSALNLLNNKFDELQKSAGLDKILFEIPKSTGFLRQEPKTRMEIDAPSRTMIKESGNGFVEKAFQIIDSVIVLADEAYSNPKKGAVIELLKARLEEGIRQRSNDFKESLRNGQIRIAESANSYIELLGCADLMNNELRTITKDLDRAIEELRWMRASSKEKDWYDWLR